MWRQYEAHDLSEYAEDGHNYMIVNAEEYAEEFDEWQEKQEWEEQEKAIQSFSQQDLPENLSGEKFSGSPKFSAVCRPCVSAYILCKRVKEKMGVYMAYI